MFARTSDAKTANELAQEIVATISMPGKLGIATLATDKKWWLDGYALPWDAYYLPKSIGYDPSIRGYDIGAALKTLGYHFIMGPDQSDFGYICPIDMDPIPRAYPWRTAFREIG